MLVALSLVTRLPFLCRGGMGEADSVVMAAGMAQWMMSDVGFGDIFLYGRQLSPGIYFVFRFLYPILFHDASHVIAFLNWINVLSSALIVIPLFLIMRRLFNRSVTTACVILILFTPLVWELGTFFHPIMPAVLLFLLAFLAWDRIAWSPRGAAFYALTFVLVAAATIMRVEVLLAVPALLVAGLIAPRKKRNLALLVSLLFLAVAAYALVLKGISKAASISFHGMPQFMDTYSRGYISSISSRAAARSVIWASLGLGIATVFLAIGGTAASLFGAAAKREARAGAHHREFIAAIVWIIPVLVLWLPQPSPIVRHYFLAALAACWLVGETILRRVPRRRAITIAAIAVACNLLVPETLYRVYNASHPGSPKEPSGSFFYSHQRTEQRIARFNGMQAGFLEALERGAGAAGSQRAPGIFIATNWESYGYCYYAMAQAGGIRRLPGLIPDPGIPLRRYALEGYEVRIASLTRFIDNPGLATLVALIRDAEREGFLVILPEEITRSEVAGELGTSTFTIY